MESLTQPGIYDRQYNGVQTGPIWEDRAHQGPSHDQRPPVEKECLLKSSLRQRWRCPTWHGVGGSWWVASRYSLDIHASADAPASQAANPPATEPDQGRRIRRARTITTPAETKWQQWRMSGGGGHAHRGGNHQYHCISKQ